MAKPIIIGLLLLIAFIIGIKNQSPETEIVQKSHKKDPKEVHTTSFHLETKVASSGLSIKPFMDKTLGILKDLDQLDQNELDDLYLKAKQEILLKEQDYLQYIKVNLSKLTSDDLGKSFFLVGSFIRYSKSPISVIDDLWSYVPTQAGPVDPHHPGHHPLMKLDKIRSYALSELKLRFEANELILDEDQSKELIDKLTQMAAFEKSLDISIEALQLLALFDQNLAEKALSHRLPRDRNLLKKLIQ